jgi:hypothetical protein
MKVVYVPNDKKNIHTLTPGKIYDVINNFELEDGSGEVYLISNNNRRYQWFHDDILMPIDKHRESNLNKIGI